MATLEGAQPDVLTFGSRASWSSILSGALLTLASSLLLLGIGWGIVMIAMDPTEFRGAFIAGGIIFVIVTFIAASVGGYVSGALIPRTRATGALHGLMACALAFLLASLFWMRFVGSTVSGVGGAAAATAQTAATTTGAATSAVGAQGGNVASGAENFLMGLGYSSAQAHTMVLDAQQSIQRGIHRGQATSGQSVEQSALNAVDSGLAGTGTAMWVYMGIWLISMGLASLFGSLAVKRVYEGVPEEERYPAGYTPTPPLRPREV